MTTPRNVLLPKICGFLFKAISTILRKEQHLISWWIFWNKWSKEKFCVLKIALNDIPPQKLELALQRFLIEYRNNSLSMTGVSPRRDLMGGYFHNWLVFHSVFSTERLQEEKWKQIEAYGDETQRQHLYGTWPYLHAKWVKGSRSLDQRFTFQSWVLLRYEILIRQDFLRRERADRWWR